jgi:sodium transport system permease protein
MAMVMPSIRLVATIFAKEMVETLRDRRTLLVALVLPLVLMPVVTLGVPFLADRQRHLRETAGSRVAIVGDTDATDLLLQAQAGGHIQRVDVQDPMEALTAGQLDAVLEIPQDFATRLPSGAVQVTIMFDESQAASVVARRRLEETVTGYGTRIVEQRLQSHGLTRQDLAPIHIGSRSVADRHRLGGVLLAGLLPFFIAIWAVLGGQHVALDVGAGEKERRTLETLLVTPPPRWVLAAGKFLAVSAASTGAVIIVIAATLISLRLGAAWGLAELRRTSVAISTGPALWILAISTLLACFLSAAQLALSLAARGVREAQQYFTPVYLLVTVPAMAAPFLEGWARSVWTYLAPGLGPMFAMRGLLLGKLPPASLGLAMASTALFTGFFLALAVRSFSQEPGVPASARPRQA